MAMLDNTFFGLAGSPDALDTEAQANDLLRRLQQAAEAGTEKGQSAPSSFVPYSGIAVTRPPEDNVTTAYRTVPTSAENPKTIAPSVDTRYVDSPPPAGPSTTTRPQPQVSSAPPMRRAGPFPVPAPAASAGGSAPVVPTQSPDFSPSFGERLQHFGNALTGRETGSLDEQVRGRKAAYEAMIGLGADPATARAAAMNPKILEMVLATKLGTKSLPSWTVIGEDRFGNKQYGFVNPSNGQVTPYAQQGVATKAETMGDTSLSGEDYLKSLPDQGEAATIRGMIEGRIKPPPMGRKNPYWEMLLEKASIAEPGFDMTKFQERNRIRQDFSAGKQAGNIKALNTVMGHLDSLDKAIEPLGNYTTAPGILNPIKDAVRNAVGDEDYQRARARFNLSKGAVASELMKVFRETGGSVTEVKDWEHKISESDSPAALKETVKSALELIGSRLNAVNDQWNRVMNVNRPLDALLSPTAREVWNRLNGIEAPAGEAPPSESTKYRGVPEKAPAGAPRLDDGRPYILNPNFDRSQPISARNPKFLVQTPD